MPHFDVVILTDARYVNPPEPEKNEYVQNVLKEDELVKNALANQGLSVSRKSWADPDFDWTKTRCVLFRSTWDYFDRYTHFTRWFSEVSSQTLLINSRKLIEWNIDKHYLDRLGRKGVRVVPTRYLNGTVSKSIHQLHEITGWKDTIIKPTIGGGGRLTYRIQPNNMAEISEKLDEMLTKEDFMLQPFQHSVMVRGEWSFMFFGEEFSHAVLKKAKPGDFRVQDDFGGTVHPYHPTPKEIAFARKAVLACPELPAYARTDVILDNDGRLAVSEIELIEPELWFRLKPEAAQKLARQVARKLSGKSY